MGRPLRLDRLRFSQQGVQHSPGLFLGGLDAAPTGPRALQPHAVGAAKMQRACPKDAQHRGDEVVAKQVHEHQDHDEDSPAFAAFAGNPAAAVTAAVGAAVGARA